MIFSREEARRIINGVTGFFAVLTEWSRAETLTPMRRKDERADPVRTVRTSQQTVYLALPDGEEPADVAAHVTADERLSRPRTRPPSRFRPDRRRQDYVAGHAARGETSALIWKRA